MFLLTTFKLSIADLKKIPIKSYIRKGKLVRSSNRSIKKLTKQLDNSKLSAKSLQPVKEFRLNYFNTEYNNRLSSLQKEEVKSWSKKLNNMNTKQLKDLTDWDDSKSVLEFIEEDIKKNPSSFRSISHEGKMMAMATVEEDKINKCLKVKNLLSNPDRLEGAKQSGAGLTSIIHMIEESVSLGYEGKLKLTALPKASKFYEKLGFKRVGSEYSFQYLLDKDNAQYLMDNHFNSSFSKNSNKDNNIKEAMKLEENIIAFAINKNS